METGLQFSTYKAALNYLVGDRGSFTTNRNVNIIPAPVYAKFTFFK